MCSSLTCEQSEIIYTEDFFFIIIKEITLARRFEAVCIYLKDEGRLNSHVSEVVYFMLYSQ